MPTRVQHSHARSAGAREKQFEALIRRSLEAVVVAALHPRALIQVVVQVGGQQQGQRGQVLWQLLLGSFGRAGVLGWAADGPGPCRPPTGRMTFPQLSARCALKLLRQQVMFGTPGVRAWRLCTPRSSLVDAHP